MTFYLSTLLLLLLLFDICYYNFYYCYNYEGCYFQYSVDKKSRPYQMSVILSYEDYKI